MTTNQNVLVRLDEFRMVCNRDYVDLIEDAIDEIARLRTRNELLEAALDNQRRIGAGAVKGTAVG